MTTGDPRKLELLLKRLHKQAGDPGPDASVLIALPALRDHDDHAIAQAIFALLLEDATTAQARSAMQALREGCVDFNELRVMTSEDIEALLGAGYPGARRRAGAIRALLGDVHARFDAMSLHALAQVGHREARARLSELAGMTPFACARVCALGLGQACLPIDERLARALVHEQVLASRSAENDLAECAAWLERHMPSEHAARAIGLLDLLRDATPAPEQSDHAQPQSPPGRPRRAEKPGRSSARAASGRSEGQTSPASPEPARAKRPRPSRPA